MYIAPGLTRKEKEDVKELAFKKGRFTSSEIKLLKKAYPRRKLSAYYAINMQKNMIVWFFDFHPHSTRKSGFINVLRHITKVPLSKSDYLDIIENYPVNNRRFIVYQYDSLESLLANDNKNGVKTPWDFINICKKYGFAKGIQGDLFQKSDVKIREPKISVPNKKVLYFPFLSYAVGSQRGESHAYYSVKKKKWIAISKKQYLSWMAKGRSWASVQDIVGGNTPVYRYFEILGINVPRYKSKGDHLTVPKSKLNRIDRIDDKRKSWAFNLVDSLEGKNIKIHG